MISTLLIANRGEIACRVIRTARRMGIATVAVYSDADAWAPHVARADAAVRIGGPSPADSYLKIDAVIDAACKAGADAVHPGYGFLSENAAFAEACAKAGLVFVGPPPEAIRAMGDKARAKALMRAAGVPVVPGYDGDDQSAERFAREAEHIGYPVLIKAAAGGGGRGMRRVDSPAGVSEAVESARREAESAFGDGTLLLEKLIARARHIEIQVFADSHGNFIHLGERDCSTQRRHQKIIEETPSPFVDEAMREAMGDTAIAAARAVSYLGAGTVEFIVGADRSFHFLEMNTRLQVEHPVTEMVTGIDLVEWQLRVAAGEPLPLGQRGIRLEGHAIEARLCAEDPFAGFSPQTGRVLHWRPEGAEGVRVDHGIAEGGAVTPHYDPLIAKLIAHGANREEAVARLRGGLLAAPLLGVVTNRAFLLDLLADDVFREGSVTTGLIDGRASDGSIDARRIAPGDRDFALAAVTLALADGDDWFSSVGRARCPLILRCGEEERRCSVRFERGLLVSIEVGGVPVPLDKVTVDLPSVHYRLDGTSCSALAMRDGRDLWIDRGGVTLRFEEPDPLARKTAAGDERVLISPVSGLLRHVAVSEGDPVVKGDLVAVVEAMKMETMLTARIDGTIGLVKAKSGDQIRAGDIVAEIVAGV